MAVLNVTNPTLADWAKRRDPNGSVAKLVELLSQTNEILHDAVFTEGNLETGHKFSVRTSLPEVEWREINKGIKASKSTSADIVESCGILQARSEVDKELADLAGNKAEFRLSEDRAFIEAMNIKQARTMFLGNPANDPREYLGFANRYNSLNGDNADSVISAGGAGNNNHSIYLVVWGEDTTHCIYPKASSAGLMHQDLGEQTVYREDGRALQAYTGLYTWKNGLVVKDWRYVVRICNIDIDDLEALNQTQAVNAPTSIIKKMNEAVYRIPAMGMGRASFYMNRKLHAGLANMAMEKTSNVLAIEKGHNQFGSPHHWVSFQGIPLRRVDALDVVENDIA